MFLINLNFFYQFKRIIIVILLATIEEEYQEKFIDKSLPKCSQFVDEF